MPPLCFWQEMNITKTGSKIRGVYEYLGVSERVVWVQVAASGDVPLSVKTQTTK